MIGFYLIWWFWQCQNFHVPLYMWSIEVYWLVTAFCLCAFSLLVMYKNAYISDFCYLTFRSRGIGHDWIYWSGCCKSSLLDAWMLWRGTTSCRIVSVTSCSSSHPRDPSWEIERPVWASDSCVINFRFSKTKPKLFGFAARIFLLYIASKHNNTYHSSPSTVVGRS